MPTEASKLAFRQAAADFRSLWEAMASSSTTAARGNYAFTLLLQEMLGSVWALAHKEHHPYLAAPWDGAGKELEQFLNYLHFRRDAICYETLEACHYALNGPLYAEPFDGPVRTGHLEQQPDGSIYVDQRAVYGFIMGRFAHLAAEAPDGV